MVCVWKGGGLSIGGASQVTISHTNIYGNQADGGGGIYVNGGLVMMTTTLIHSNIASSGSQAMPMGGLWYYNLPTPPGYWLPNADCVANREACQSWEPCHSLPCSTLAGTAANGWTPTPCKAPLVIQPCDWQIAACAQETQECPLGKKIYFVPFFTINETFPNPCVAGYLGSSDAQYQVNSDCAGKCPAGTYCPSATSTHAEDCPRGSFCPEGSSLPRPCPEGSYSSATGLTSANECIPTDPGYFAPSGSAMQTPCAAGTIASAPSSSCTQCEAGTYQEEEGKTACSACPTASYCPQGAATPTVCPPGTFNPSTGATSNESCTTCKAGFWCTGGMSIPCVANTYRPNASSSATSQASCLVCPGNSTTAGQENASSVADCKCNADFYDSNVGEGVECKLCPIGTRCTPGTTLDLLPIKRGYYRRSPSSVDVRRCPDAGTNCSDAPECDYSTSGCSGSIQASAQTDHTMRIGESETPPSLGTQRRLQGVPQHSAASLSNGANLDAELCQPGLTGVFCQKCVQINANDAVFYSKATAEKVAECLPCGEFVKVNTTLFILIGIAAGVVGMALLLQWVCRRKLTAQQRAQLLASWVRLKPLNKLKILISFYMIATKVDNVYEVEFPSSLKRMLNVIAIGVSLNLDGLGSTLECVGFKSYLSQLLAFTIMPACAALLIFTLALIWACCRMKRAPNRLPQSVLELATPWILWLLFLVYPPVATMAFEAWPCYRFERASFLKADVDVQCDTAEHDNIQAVAWSAIALYPFGLLALNGALLFRARDAICHRKPTTFSSAIAFLYREYEPHLFWWELVEMVRRLVLVGLMVLMQGTMLQLVVGTTLALIFLVLQVQAQPYASMEDDLLATVCSFALVVVFLCAYAFKDAELVDLAGIQAKMSDELRERYVLDHFVLTVILWMAVLGAIIALVVIFMLQLGVEMARRRREQLSAKARRLRRKSDLKEVEAPCLPPKSFHLFLSHVWRTGQDQMRVIKQRLMEMVPNLVVFLDVDDLTDGKGAEYVDKSEAVLIFLSNGYFQSANCMRELLRAVFRRKRLITLSESDLDHGRVMREEVYSWLQEADEKYEKWGLAGEMETWGMAIPTPGFFFDLLYNTPSNEVIEWTRIGVFQDVTLRNIAERLLPADLQGNTFVQDELLMSCVTIPPPKQLGGCSFHLFCSSHNQGACELVQEANKMLHLDAAFTSKIDEIGECAHMLVYLNKLTWTSGDKSVRFAMDVDQALLNGVHLLLVHEMPGEGGQEQRHGCDFGLFFACPDGETPRRLLKNEIYNEIAVPLKGGPLREPSMHLFAMAIGHIGQHHQGRVLSVDREKSVIQAIVQAGREQSVQRIIPEMASSVRMCVDQQRVDDYQRRLPSLSEASWCSDSFKYSSSRCVAEQEPSVLPASSIHWKRVARVAPILVRGNNELEPRALQQALGSKIIASTAQPSLMPMSTRQNTTEHIAVRRGSVSSNKRRNLG